MDPSIEIFRRPPEAPARRLLVECGLPASDLDARHFEDFLGCGRSDLRGVVGLEVFGCVALLRSLGVAEEARGAGCGRALVEGIEAHARQRGVSDLYLLTTTAEAFFVRLGYTRMERDQAPGPITRTKEFSDLCPGSAVLMMKRLTPRGGP